MVGVAGLVWAATMTGCLGYSNYPQEDGVTWVNARDTASIREPMAKALAHIIELDIADQTNMELPGDGPLVAVNVPGGIAPESYRWIADKAGGGAGGRATPLSETVSGLPIYHIGAVRIRSNGVRVDVLRPITGLERDVANPVYVGVEVWMKGATGVRQIDHIRWREVGTMTVPALYTIEDIERAFNPEPEPEVESGG
ncbi:MAG: hypothetical protein COB69_10205 [Phycisphaera sp.]|nr:MAG: hypothetical protein COB69_10205 [Phycisphaera sp.]